MDTSDNEPRAQKTPRVRRPTKKRIFLAVHRFENALYYKRLEPQAYRLLTALRDGATLADACNLAVNGGDGSAEEAAAKIGSWFKSWASLGWFRKAEGHPILREPGRPRPGPGRARLSSPKSGSKVPRTKQPRRKTKRSTL
jgi:hypothetical protein